MITFLSGDLFEAKAAALVNAVNCVGVMGRGVALEFKRAFPANFDAYKSACARGDVRLGEVFVFERPESSSPQFIINFPTKRHWRSKSRLDDIERGLDDLAAVIDQRSMDSVALPALGCGLGGLEWDAVKALIESKLGDLQRVDVQVYAPL